MTVLLLEDNLMWSVRLKHGVAALGHTPIVIERLLENFPKAEVAILNLGSPKLATKEAVATLQSQGTRVVAHAGHKEGALLSFAKELGCDETVTNGALSHKLAKILGDTVF